MHAIQTVSVFVLVAWLAVVSANADVITWDGTASRHWQNAAAWNPHRVPVDGDTATVDGSLASQFPFLVADTDRIDGLSVINGGWISTSAYRLNVDDALPAPTTIDGINSRIVVGDNEAQPLSPSFDTDLLFLENGGLLELTRASVIVEADVGADIDASSTLGGRGTVRFGNAGTRDGTQVLNNEGTISAYRTSTGFTSGLTLTLKALGGGRLDLDGDNESGVVQVDDDGPLTLFVDGRLKDSFSGTLEIGKNGTVEFVDAWSIHGGDIRFAGGTSFFPYPATLTGAPVTATDATFVVDDHTRSVIGSDLTIVSGTFATGLDSELQFDGDVTFESAATLDLDAVEILRINGDTEVNQTTIDLDGTGHLLTTITTAAKLILNVDSIDDEGDGYDGEMQIQGGTLDANVTGGWVCNGRIDLSGVATITGSLVTVDSNLSGGGIYVGESSVGRIGASNAFAADAQVTVPATGFLVLNGPTTTLAGGDWAGQGTVYFDADITTVTAPTTINVAAADLDGINESGDSWQISSELRLSVHRISADATNRFDGDTIQIQGPGRLWVDFPVASDSWEMAGQLNLVNDGTGAPQLTGNPVVISGSLTVTGGRADIYADVTVTSGASLIESSGALVQHGDFFQDGGRLTLENGGQVFTHGMTTFEPASEVEADGVWELNGTTTFRGGSFTGDGMFVQRGDVTVASSTSIGPRVWFDDGSTTLIANSQELTLGGDSRISTGAAFSGSGTLQIDTGSSLEIQDGAIIDVAVQNDGELYLGSSPGGVEVNQFVQSTAGTLVIEITGAGIDQYDRLTVATVSEVAGTLDVRLSEPGIGPLFPSGGETFTFLVSGGAIEGRFDTENLPPDHGGISFDVEYDTRKLILFVRGVAGDYNGDGIVDPADYTAWRDSLGETGASLAADGDGSGTIDQADYDVWRMNFGMHAFTAASYSTARVPEPGTRTLLLALMGLLTFSVDRARISYRHQ